MTAQADPAICLRALKSGANDFLSKPFDLQEVSLRIKNLLEVSLMNKRLREHNEFLEKTVRERSVDLISARELLEGEKDRGELAAASPG